MDKIDQNKEIDVNQENNTIIKPVSIYFLLTSVSIYFILCLIEKKKKKLYPWF